MLRHTAAPQGESRYEVLTLFTASMVASSLIVVAIGALLPYMAHAFPQDRDRISMLVSSLLLGTVLTNAVSGAATDRFGDKAVLIVCGIVMGGALLAASAAASFNWILVWFVIYGMGFAATNPVGSHAILFFFKPEERGLAMGIRQMGVPLGGVAGAILLSTTAEYFGYRGALVTSGIVVLAVTLGSALLYREPAQLHGKPLRAGVLLKDIVNMGREPRLLLITLTSVILFAGQVALMGFFPLTLINEAHMSAGFACVFFVISQFAAAAGRTAWGWASDRIFHGDRLLPLAVTCVLTALAAVAVAHAGQMRIPALAGVAVLLGFSAEGWFGLSVIAMAETGGEAHAGSAMGFGLTWVEAAGVIVPGLFLSLMQRAGNPAAWNALALLSLAGVIPAFAAIALSQRSVASIFWNRTDTLNR